MPVSSGTGGGPTDVGEADTPPRDFLGWGIAAASLALLAVDVALLIQDRRRSS
jgi:hypothetical protein